MTHRYNLPEIEEGYTCFFQKALENKEDHLPYYEIQPWDQTLAPIELEVFREIRGTGLRLYPIFPVAPGTFLHFANPFLRIGIEIVFKNTPPTLLNRKRLLLKSQRWVIYTIPSQCCDLSIEEFFKSRRTRDNVEFEDLSHLHQLQFFEKFHRENITCLLEYIRYKHFEKEYA